MSKTLCDEANISQNSVAYVKADELDYFLQMAVETKFLDLTSEGNQFCHDKIQDYFCDLLSKTEKEM